MFFKQAKLLFLRSKLKYFFHISLLSSAEYIHILCVNFILDWIVVVGKFFCLAFGYRYFIFLSKYAELYLKPLFMRNIEALKQLIGVFELHPMNKKNSTVFSVVVMLLLYNTRKSNVIMKSLT